ncbi:MAG: hypothetical protein ACXWLA_05715, partial [Myxococcaceae bacterium]
DITGAAGVSDRGPAGGAGGGRVLATGTPEQVATVEASHTGRYLARVLERGRAPRRPAEAPEQAAAVR